jgi:hypothetical protein
MFRIVVEICIVDKAKIYVDDESLSGSEATLLPHPPPKNGAGLFQGTPLKPFSTPFDGRGFTTAESRL